MNRPIQIISAPSILGLKPTGVEQMPESLLKTGLLGRLQYIEPPVIIPTLNAGYDSHRDPETKCLNPFLLRDFSLDLMKCIAGELAKSTFPLVLGGDCTILIGIMPALKSAGNFGLIFLDAHADFYEPEKSTTGECADMDLAIVTGRGPELLTNINNLRPYVEDKNVIHLGQRDAGETVEYGSQDIRETAIKVFDLSSIRSSGLDAVIADVVKHLEALNLEGFWIHFDTDVISDGENPAVDYRLPGGLSFSETGHLLNRLLGTGRVAGMSVTIYNPTLDKTGEIAIKICDCLNFAFEDNGGQHAASAI